MRFLFTCGGTAGHINPALAIAGRLQEMLGGCKILFIGAKGMMETELVPREGYEIREIEITNISREHSLHGMAHNINTLKNVAVSTEKAKKRVEEKMIGASSSRVNPLNSSAMNLTSAKKDGPFASRERRNKPRLPQ